MIAVLLASCAGFSPSATVKPLVTSTLPSGGDVAIVEVGDATYAFNADLVNVIRGGKIVARVPAPKPPWEGAASLAAPDGQGRWAVGISGGVLWRVTATGNLEEANERLGVADAKALAIAAAGDTSIIGVTGGAIVSTDGVHVMRFAGPDPRRVAASRGRVAVSSGNRLDIYDLVRSQKVSYPVSSPRYLGFVDATTDHATLVVDLGGELYTEEHGRLVEAHAPRAESVALSGARVWLLADRRLYARDRGGFVEVDAPAGERIFGSRTGGVWVEQAAERAIRYTLDVPSNEATWHELVEPVFQRACASCHLPGGDADLDLSTPGAWAFRRNEIVQRVLLDRTMPPAGTELTDAERHALASWLEHPK